MSNNEIRRPTDEERAALDPSNNEVVPAEVNSVDVVSQEKDAQAYTKPEGDQSSDEKNKQPVEEVPVDAVPVPHTVDENPEEHIGEETADPWADDAQTDWANNEPFEDPTPTRVDNPVYNPNEETSN